MDRPRSEGARAQSTFWILLGHYGPTMSIEQIRDEFFPSVMMKTMRNKACAGQLPPRTGEVYDTRDVADWWDALRRSAA